MSVPYLRPEVLRFLEAQTHLTLATARARQAEAERRNADNACRRAWDALTPSEAQMVNDACRGLNEPETQPRHSSNWDRMQGA